MTCSWWRSRVRRAAKARAALAVGARALNGDARFASHGHLHRARYGRRRCSVSLTPLAPPPEYKGNRYKGNGYKGNGYQVTLVRGPCMPTPPSLSSGGNQAARCPPARSLTKRVVLAAAWLVTNHSSRPPVCARPPSAFLRRATAARSPLRSPGAYPRRRQSRPVPLRYRTNVKAGRPARCGHLSSPRFHLTKAAA